MYKQDTGVRIAVGLETFMYILVIVIKMIWVNSKSWY